MLSSSGNYRLFCENKYFAALDVLRAFSIVAVIYFHSVPYDFAKFGSQGVTLFFAISGFLITTIILRSKGDDGAFAIKSFYARRCLRIWPLYFAVLLVYVAAVLLAERDEFYKQQFFSNLKYFSTFSSNWFVGLDQPRVIFYFAWSLAAEEQFYLVWPWVERYLKGMRPALVAGTLVLFTSTAAWLVPGRSENLPLTIILSISPAICFGVILAHLMHRPQTFQIILRYAGRPSSTPIAIVLMLAAVMLVPDFLPLKGTFVGLAMAILVATCVVREDNIVARLTAFRSLVWLGVVSYGVYMLHMLVLNLMRRGGGVVGVSNPVVLFVVTTVASTVLATVSYQYYERPFLALKKRWHL